MSFTPSLVAVSAVIGALFGGTMALVWRKAWWSGALAFSVPSLLGGSFGWSSGQWQRVMGVGLCILAAGFAAFVVRYPGPRNLKQ